MIRHHHSLLLLSLFTISAYAKESLNDLPLAQLQAGKWQVERQISKPNEPGNEPTLRTTTYCTDPQKELHKLFNMANLLCKTEVKRVDDKTFDLSASCKLPIGLKGSNHSRLALLDATHYTLETHTKGSKFGEEVERRESIKATRLGDCDEHTTK